MEQQARKEGSDQNPPGILFPIQSCQPRQSCSHSQQLPDCIQHLILLVGVPRAGMHCWADRAIAKIRMGADPQQSSA